MALKIVKNEEEIKDQINEIESLREQLPANVEGTKEFNEDQEMIQIKNLLLLCKTSDNTVHLMPLTKEQQMIILQVLVKMSPENSLLVKQEPEQGINWESEVDLTK